MDAFTIVHRSPARSTRNSAPRSSADLPHLMDDAAAQEVHRLIGDRLLEAHDTIHAAIGAVNRSTYEAGSHERKMARALVQQAWRELAAAARILAEPAPRFRPNSTAPIHEVRHRQLDAEFTGVEDIRRVSLPARIGVAR